jgi:hypothetical protein
MARYEQRPRAVTVARYLGEYKVWLEFDDGRKGVVDLADDLHGEVYQELRDPTRFSQVYLDTGLGTITWPEGGDIAPDLLYEKLRSVH